MKLSIIKSVSFIALFFVIWGLSTHISYAFVPDVEGYVLVKGTNAPVAGVWVKLTSDEGYSRYEMTDSSGHFEFLAYQVMTPEERDARIGVMIDTNLDGSDDAAWWPRGADGTAADFNCKVNPYKLTAVRPYNWSGTFDSIGGTTDPCELCLDNYKAAVLANPIFYHPSGVSLTPTGPTLSPSPSPSAAPLPSCTISLSSVLLSGVGSSQSKTVGFPKSSVGGSVVRVDFSSGNAAVASVTTPDTSASFQTLVTSTGIGTTTYTAVATMNDAASTQCSATANVTVAAVKPWCQFKETDIMTNGSILCSIPVSCIAPGCINSLILKDSGEAPGIAIANGSISFGSGNISKPVPPYGWKTKSPYSGNHYSYKYFEDKIKNLVLSPILFAVTSVDDLKQGSLQQGYYWSRYNVGGTLTIDGDLLLGDSKIILFVDGDLVIHNKITLNKGQGFLMAVVSGNIIVDPNVTNLEGIYFSDRQFRTGTKGTDNDVPLSVRGSVAAFDEIVMQRHLTDNSSIPAETFEFGPDLLMRFPSQLGQEGLSWKEVAP